MTGGIGKIKLLGSKHYLKAFQLLVIYMFDHLIFQTFN
jgi:hypothetical protein